KAQEDTLFYRYGRLLSRNEVGSDPGVVSIPVQAFQRFVGTRAATAPAAMLATATHDHKRGEDARARLAVLTQDSSAWQRFSQTAQGAMESLQRARSVMDTTFRYMTLQTLVGAWPPGMRADDDAALRSFFERLEL